MFDDNCIDSVAFKTLATFIFHKTYRPKNITFYPKKYLNLNINEFREILLDLANNGLIELEVIKKE
jgi:hypothetical protein